jgi:hypothetical protein
MNPIILLIIPLLVLAPSLAYATADSDYRTGYTGVIDVYKCLAHPEFSNGTIKPDCDTGAPITPSNHYVCSDGDKEAANMTACTDGYANGFVDWCAKNKADCAEMIKTDNGPYIHKEN